VGTSGDIPAPLVLRARGLHKRFSGVHAVKGVDLDLRAGRIHALVGENGAGKSTLIKMITGALAPDAGEVTIHGRVLPVVTPATALRAGVAAIHQEPNVVPALSPVANVFLGQTLTRLGWRREREMRRRFDRWADALGVELPSGGAAGRLPVGACQLIEIVRALEHGADVVVMDEPTASLSLEERRGLFRIIELLRGRGTAIVYISHHLDDVLRIADVVTVMRDGAVVATVDAADASVDSLVAMMLDSSLEEVLHGTARPGGPGTTPASAARAGAAGPAPALRVANLSVRRKLHGVDLAVSAGEIVGIAGLVGSGRSTLLRALGGAVADARGELWLDGVSVPMPRTPRQAQRRGVSLAPEDRRTEGLVLSRSSAENLVLSSLSSAGRAGFASPRSVRRIGADASPRIGFDPMRLDARAATLSGGNQQKLVLGKMLLARPKVLLVDEPTRGVDVGAKAEIFRLLRSLAADGMAIVMVSEETDELVSFVDRVVVLRRGTVAASFDAGSADPDDVLSSMFP
jgi:ABC-type sugar transport system ATPase subunit